MIRAKEAPHVIRSEGDDGSDDLSMTIDQSSIAHIINMLRNQLYGDKIGSPIREYCANAVDAHVAAGIRDRPIEVHIPSADNLMFQVVDYGPGLTYTEMDDVFRKFGKSTKASSNDSIGAFGIGAKSGFAYTASFMVKSRTARGVSTAITTYNCYIDETSLGKISRLTVQDNPERDTGITIEIPVEEGDERQFYTSAFEQTQYFQPQPLFFREGERIDPPEWYTKKGSAKKVEDVEMAIHDPIAVMGGIGYKIEPRYVKRKLRTDVHGRQSQLGQAREALLAIIWQLNPIIRAQIGELDIDSSREGLQYTPRTIRFLWAHAMVVGRKIKRQVYEAIFSAPTMLQAIWSYHMHCPPLFTSVAAVPWRGRRVTEQALTNAILDRVSKDRLQVYPLVPTAGWFEGSLKNVLVTRRYGKPGDQIAITFDDFGPYAKSEASARADTFFEANPSAYCVVFTPPKRFPKLASEGVPTAYLQTMWCEQVFPAAITEILQESFNLKDVPLLTSYEQAKAYWLEFGGTFLSDYVPKVYPKDPAEPKPDPVARRTWREALDQTSCAYFYYPSYKDSSPSEGRKRLGDLLDVPQRNVVYWILQDSVLKSQDGLESWIARRWMLYGRNSIPSDSSFLSWLQVRYGIRCLLIFLPFEKVQLLDKVKPSTWQEGSQFLRENLPTMVQPEFLPYMLKNESYVRSGLDREPFRSLDRMIYLQEFKTALQFFLQPMPAHTYKRAELPENDEVQTLKSAKLEISRWLDTFTGSLLTEYPAYYAFSGYHLATYLELLDTIQAKEDRISLLESLLITHNLPRYVQAKEITPEVHREEAALETFENEGGASHWRSEAENRWRHSPSEEAFTEIRQGCYYFPAEETITGFQRELETIENEPTKTLAKAEAWWDGETGYGKSEGRPDAQTEGPEQLRGGGEQLDGGGQWGSPNVPQESRELQSDIV